MNNLGYDIGTLKRISTFLTQVIERMEKDGGSFGDALAGILAGDLKGIDPIELTSAAQLLQMLGFLLELIDYASKLSTPDRYRSIMGRK